MKTFNRGGVVWGRWTVNGRQVRVSSGTSDEKLAKQFLTEKYAESFRESRLGELRRRTWGEATKRYLDEHSSLRTYKQYEAHSKWWTEEFRKRKLVYLDELSPDTVKLIRDAEAARPKLRGGGKRSPADVNRKIAYLRAVMNAAFDEYRWFGDKASAPLYRFIPGEVERLRYLKPEEVMRLVDKLPAPYNAMARFAVATGLRRGNVMEMKWEDVDLGSRTVTIPGVRMKNGELLRIPLNEMAVQVLRSQAEKSETLVFPLADGSEAYEIPSKVWQAALKAAGLKNVRWHDLRHTWASISRQNGVPTEVIQELGGWKDARMVMRYSHLNIDHLYEHAGAMDRAFSTDLAQSAVTNIVPLRASA